MLCGFLFGWQNFAYHFWVTLTLISDLVLEYHVLSISPISFELGIPNLVCGCILEWQSVMFQFLGHCDLDLASRIIVTGAYLVYYLREESHILCMDAFFDVHMSYTILDHCDLYL